MGVKSFAETPDFVIVGGGLVGMATALTLSRDEPKANILLLEKEAFVGRHQSTHNSGVLHCGLYYKPGSLKARLAVEGIRKMTEFCRQHDIAHEICGKVVVAVDREEENRLRVLQERGTANGLVGLQWLGVEELREIEPYASGVAALRVPEEGIVDYAAVCDALRRELESQGVRVVLKARVTDIRYERSIWQILTAAGEFCGRFLINCAGLFCDKVAEIAGETVDARIIPFRGEYFQLKPEAAHFVRHLIYPVPDPVFPFLGVHFTRLIGGGIEVGPNAVLAFAREGYRKSDIVLGELLESLTFGGLWRFLGKHRKMVVKEIACSLSKRRFCSALQRLVPDIREEHLAEGGAGVRAQAMLPDGTLVQDFRFAEGKNALHVLNAPSPAATSSLAIGNHIAQHIFSHQDRRPAAA